MPFPTYKKIETALLIFIYNSGGTVSPSACYEPLAIKFNLSNDEIVRVLKDKTNRPQWNNMVQWARRKLVDYKYLHTVKESGKGRWVLTKIGTREARAVAEVDIA